MAPKVTWKGFLNVSLVSMAVKAYSASSAHNGAIHLHQLHQDCHQRIRYQKTCAQHGPVSADEVVMGYEYRKDQYVVIDPAEVDQLRSDEEKRAIQIDTFVGQDQVSFLYFTDKHYYLLPEGAAAELPYALLQQAMQDKSVQAIGQVVLSKKEQLVLLRPWEELLMMTVLKYASQVRLPACLGDERPSCSLPLGKQEQSLAARLIRSRTRRKLDLAQYLDRYTDKLTQLIEAKVQGQQLVTPPPSEPPAALNLIEALRASVDESTSAHNTPADDTLAGELSRGTRQGRQKTSGRSKARRRQKVSKKSA